MDLDCSCDRDSVGWVRGEIWLAKAHARGEGTDDSVDCGAAVGKHFGRQRTGVFCGWNDGRADHDAREISFAAGDFANVGDAIQGCAPAAARDCEGVGSGWCYRRVGVARKWTCFSAGAVDLCAERDASVGGELQQGCWRYSVVAARTGSEHRGASESSSVAS